MRGIGHSLGLDLMDPSAELLGTQPAMHGPLLVPGCLQSRRRHPPEPVHHLGEAEGDEAVLDHGMPVRVGVLHDHATVGQDRLGALIQNDQRGVEKRLVQKVVVHPFGQVAPVANVKRRLFPARLAPRRNSHLDLQPLAVAGDEVIAGARRPVALLL